MVLEDVEANVAIAVHVAVVEARAERDLSEQGRPNSGGQNRWPRSCRESACDELQVCCCAVAMPTCHTVLLWAAEILND